MEVPLVSLSYLLLVLLDLTKSVNGMYAFPKIEILVINGNFTPYLKYTKL